MRSLRPNCLTIRQSEQACGWVLCNYLLLPGSNLMDICCEVNYPNRLHCSTGNCDCLTNLLINSLDLRSVEYSRSEEKAMVENRMLTSAFPKR